MPEIAPGILVFDSGVGGLSVCTEIQHLRPDAHILYVADTGFFPYGSKDEGVLSRRVCDVVRTAIAQSNHPIHIIVIACNTASTVCLPELRDMVRVPVVGTVPAIKPAATQSKSRVIGLLGTPGTVRRRYTQELIDQFAPDCQIIRVGSAALVQQAEQSLTGTPLDDAILATEIAPFFAPDAAGLDIVVLACTHFPLLRADLMRLAPTSVDWIDSGAAIARRTDLLLQQAGFSPTAAPSLPPGSQSMTTAPDLEHRYQRAFGMFGLCPPINIIVPEPITHDA